MAAQKNYTWLWLLAGAAVLWYLYSRGILSGVLATVTGTAATANTANNVNTSTVTTVPSGTLTKTSSVQQSSATTSVVAKTGTVPTYQFSKPSGSSGSASVGGSAGGLASTGGKASYNTPCPSVNGQVYVRDLNGNCVPYGSAGHSFKVSIPNMSVGRPTASQIAASNAILAANLAKYGTKYPQFKDTVVNGKLVQTYVPPSPPSSHWTGYWTGPVVVKQNGVSGSSGWGSSASGSNVLGRLPVPVTFGALNYGTVSA